MKQDVSKARTRKTRTRQKKSGRRVGKRSIGEQPGVGLMICAILWAAAVFLIDMERFLVMPMSFDDGLTLAGEAVFALIGVFTAGLLVFLLEPEAVQKNSLIALLASIVLVSLIPAKLLVYSWQFFGWPYSGIVIFLLPFTIAPLMTTIMSGSSMALATGALSTLFMGLIARGILPATGNSAFVLLAAGIAVTVITAQVARRIKTRSKVFRTASVVGLAEVTCVLGFTALNWQTTDLTMVFHMAGACIASAFFSALLVLLITPLLESTFNVATDITLLELSDLGHPLLQRLALEAPGTYHHSLVTASLSQAAAEEIGANPLLARVSSYFHDVGKLTKPGLFAENIRLHDNPHDNLSPNMSTLVITSHVKEGLSLAMFHKLPEVVRQAIREHHGTSVLSFFHHKAKEMQKQDSGGQGQGKESARVNKNDFRYSGPKPSSRESAVICLADAVEAASRSLEKPTPQRIEELVDEIVTRRTLDGQLEKSDLKMSDVNRIKKAFVFTLTNMMHARMPYPKDEDTDKQQPENQKARSRGSKEANRAPRKEGAAS